jgi:enolase
MKINDIQLKIILDSRGKETLEAKMNSGNISVSASVPSGKSTGSHEVFVLEPHKAIERFEKIKHEILTASGRIKNQRDFDKFLISLDGTGNKSNLGGNLILALSLTFARLKAKTSGQELWKYIHSIQQYDHKTIQLNNFPKPIFNVINGGAHSNNNLSIQEFQVIPTVNDFAIGFSIGKEFYKKLYKILEKKFGKENIKLGDEAGFSAPFKSNEEAIEILSDLIKKNHYPLQIGLDAAANGFFTLSGKLHKEKNERDIYPHTKSESLKQFYQNPHNIGVGVYIVDGKEYAAERLAKYYENLITHYNIISIEDPFYEEGFNDFAKLTKIMAKINHHSLVIADDLTTTNHDRLEKAIKEKSGNAILIKLNQIGTLTETLDVINLAYRNNWKVIVSHRSGETMDDFIADLAVAVGAWGIKAGAPAKPERLAKYDRLLEIYKGKHRI